MPGMQEDAAARIDAAMSQVIEIEATKSIG
jgi:hypothetical protein